jgi:hypothetical protein
LVAVPLKFTVELAQTELEPVLMVMVGVAVEPTVMVIVFELAVTGDAQAAFEVSAQDTTSLLLSVELVNDELLVPALLPFICHW